MTSSPELRKQLRQRRRALDAATRAAYTASITQHLTQSRVFRASKRIASYLACDGEVDCSEIVRRAWATRKRVTLPVLLGPFHNHLRFAPYSAATLMRKNCFGIPEPRVPKSRMVAGIALDLVLVPLVGFDDSGTRLGMGGGYYDRSFTARRFRKHWCKPRLLGVAFEAQRVARLRRNAWDVPLDGVVTEKGLYWFD